MLFNMSLPGCSSFTAQPGFLISSDSSSDVLKLLFDDNHALGKLQVSNIQEENAFENSSYYL